MTREYLLEILRKLAIRNANLVVHATEDSFGDVDGGVDTICQVLIEAIGPGGTMVVPTFTVSETLLGPGRTAVPYQPTTPVSPTLNGIGETFRKLPGVQRTHHPTHSFAVWGARAEQVLSTQRDNNPLGPMKKLNVMQGGTLLLGTGLSSATALYLAEEQMPNGYLERGVASRLNSAGYNERVVIPQLPGCSVAFDKLDAHLEAAEVFSFPLPGGMARKIPIRYLVRVACSVLNNNPTFFACDREGCESCAAKRASVR